jgi:hypothetical protein
MPQSIVNGMGAAMNSLSRRTQRQHQREHPAPAGLLGAGEEQRLENGRIVAQISEPFHPYWSFALNFLGEILLFQDIVRPAEHWARMCRLQSFARRGLRGAVKRAVGNLLGLLRHASRRERTHFGGNAISGSAVSPFNVVDEPHPDVPVDRAPVRHHVFSVTGRMRFDCTDFQSPRAHWAQGRGFRQLHDCLHASQQLDPARATRRESMSGRASHRSSKK